MAFIYYIIYHIDQKNLNLKIINANKNRTLLVIEQHLLVFFCKFLQNI